MTILIMKFGGTCLRDERAFNRILEIITYYKDSKKIFILSAFYGIRDLLLELINSLNPVDHSKVEKFISQIARTHNDLIDKTFPRDSIYYHKTKDWVELKLNDLADICTEIGEFGLEDYYFALVSSFGETLSTYILCEYLQSKGIDSLYFPSNEIIITDDNFNNAFPLYKLINNRVQKYIVPILESDRKNIVPCITGFIGRNKIGNITSMGKGGSDYTATILAHSLYDVGKDKNIKVILWKDVDGLYTINPKYIPESALIKNINYSEAIEIANFGAKLTHPKCLEALETVKIPLEIRNFNNPTEQSKYSLISELTDKETIKGISVIEDAAIINIVSGSMVDVPGVLAKIFKIIAKNGINVSLVTQSASEISTSFVVDQKDELNAIKALKNNEFFRNFFKITSENVAIINITGLKILDNILKAKVFEIFARSNIRVRAISQSFEEINISLVIDKNRVLEAIKVLYNYINNEFEGLEPPNKKST